MKLWIVFQWLGNSVVQLQGVFDDEALAVEACRDATYYVGCVTLNEELPHETVPWSEVWYPHLESKEGGTARCRTYVEGLRL